MMGEHNELKNRYLHIRWKEIKGDVVEEPMEYVFQVSSQKIENNKQKSLQKGLQENLQKADVGLQKKRDIPQMIITLIERDANVTTTAMAEMIGVSRQSIAKHIAKLKEQGVIRRIGPDKGGHWEVSR